VRKFYTFLATMGPVGYVPIAPATAGSAVVALIGWFLPTTDLLSTLALIAVGAVIAAWLAGEAERELGKDAKPIVVDEAVGQSLALLFVPHTIPAFILAFLLFRIFDVWKPLGARQIQRLEGGKGVVADDIIAGLVACGVFQAGWWAVRAWGWAQK
jgi:phosphatidylglycerophosphatase A